MLMIIHRFMAAGKVFDEKKPVMNEEQSEII